MKIFKSYLKTNLNNKKFPNAFTNEDKNYPTTLLEKKII